MKLQQFEASLGFYVFSFLFSNALAPLFNGFPGRIMSGKQNLKFGKFLGNDTVIAFNFPFSNGLPVNHFPSTSISFIFLILFLLIAIKLAVGVH